MAMSEEPVTKAETHGSALLRWLIRVALLVLIAWGCAALWFDGPSSRPLAALLVALFGLGSAWLLFFVRPFRRGTSAALLLLVLVLGWWLGPSQALSRLLLRAVAPYFLGAA